MRHLLALAIGLTVGIAGATLYLQSLPPEPGSLAAKAEKSQLALKKAQTRIAALEARTARNPHAKPGDTFADRTRRIAEDIRAGRLVDVDDVFDATKPIMRDLGPLFDRMRLRQQKQHFDTVAGKFSRKYNLNPAQENALAAYLEKKAEQNAAHFNQVMTSESSTFEDFMRATQDVEQDDGLDAFMERTLTGETREQFKTDRLLERVERVQQEADRKVERLDTVVGLDENQKDQVFAYMARSSRHFDRSMQFEGLSGDSSPLVPGQSRNDAILSVLRPEQRATYEEHRRLQREEAEADLREVGMKLPENWDVFDESDI